MNNLTKICSTCKEPKTFDCFTKSKNKPDGCHNQCRDCRKKYYYKNDIGRKTWENNKDQMNKAHKAWCERNRDRYNGYMRTWNKSNKDYSDPKILALGSKHRAARITSTPKWFDETHQRKVEKLYQLAKTLQTLTGIKFEVDHVYPITNENCNGLHVWWNMRVLPQKENRSKANKLDNLENIMVPRVSEDCFELYLASQFKMYADLYRKHKV